MANKQQLLDNMRGEASSLCATLDRLSAMKTEVRRRKLEFKAEDIGVHNVEVSDADVQGFLKFVDGLEDYLNKDKNAEALYALKR
jgi:hypothetical protein